MRSLPLYAQSEPLPIETEAPRGLDTSCTRCAFSRGVRTPCMGADGEPGGVLLLGEAPTHKDDQNTRPFTGDAGRAVRLIMDGLYKGPVVYDYAVRCAPTAALRDSKAEVSKAIAACRGYAASTYAEAAPTRIIALGPMAVQSVLGRGVSGFQMRRSYAYTEDGVPVFVLMNPAATLRNRFLREWLEEDLKWALTANPPPPPMRGRAYLIETVDDARQALAFIRQAEWASFDIESAGLLFTPSFRLLSASLTPKGSRDGFVWTHKALADTGARAALFEYLADAEAGKLGANIKFDILGTQMAGGKVRGVRGDVRLWRKLLEPESSGKLADMANLVGMGGHKLEAKQAMEAAAAKVEDRLKWEARMKKLETAPPLKSGKARKLPPEPPTLAEVGVDASLEPVVRDPDQDKGAWVYSLLPDDVLYRYNARDTVSTTVLGEQMEPQLAADPDLKRTWDVLVGPASLGVVQIETWGIAVDKDALLTFDMYLSHKLQGAQAMLDAFQPGTNWNSADQIRAYLFGKLRLPVIKMTESGEDPSTDADVLEQLSGKHPAVEALLAFRRFTKLRGTYAQGLLPHVRPDGRIHPTILLDGARSGRASCADPNLQNIPRAGTVEGKMARDVFIARKGYVLLELDYSQIELRVAAMLSRDPLMRQIFDEGHDFHQRTAEMVSQMAWGVAPENVTSEHRSQAKWVNFGAMYGQGPSALAKKLKISFAQAETIQAAIFGKFKTLSTYFRTCLTESRKTGSARTFWAGQAARRRPLWKIAEPDDGVRLTAEHGSWNTPIQGSAADFLTASIGAVVRWLLESELDAKLCLVVHDSMLFEVREDLVDQVALAVREIMQSWPSDGVPILVDAKTGQRWGSLKHYDFPAAEAA